MKRLLFQVPIILLLTFGCNSKRTDPAENVTKYYKAFNNSDYDQVKALITDSITIISGDYIMPYSAESYYEHFKWDSVFQPTYKLLELEELGDQLIATVEVNSLRFEFLKNNPLTCKHKISFKSGKLAKFESLDCIGADWELWQKEIDSLVSWVNIHHPELNGFIHDLTMKGAVNYLKAIELYENSKTGP